MLSRLALAASLGLAGARPQQHSRMIFGGVEAEPGEIPYIVSLGSYALPPPLNWHVCGGVLISPTVVLTAAHCGANFVPDDVFVRAGSLSVVEGGVTANVTSIHNHPLYNKTAVLDHDIGIWELSEPIADAPGISYAELPAQGSDPEPGEMTTSSGWGLQVPDEWVLAEKLMKVDLPIISREKCTALYEGFRISVTENMICAGDEEGGKSVCSGDSGGPAVDSSGVLVGLASWLDTCGPPNSPGVYTRVGKYIDWIADTISKESW